MAVHLIPVMIGAIFIAAMTLYFQGAANSDFMAVYMAGLSLAEGRPDQVYPALVPVFDLSYPDSWRTLATAQGFDAADELYPFIYPPIWAVVASWVAPMVSLSAITAWLPLVDSVLLIGCSWLAWRITRSSVRLDLWLSVGFLTMATTTFGYVALAQGQPQILTTFLILLAIERSRAGASLSAGGVLALAASIKVYPLLLIVVWIARKDWRAVASFVVFGAAVVVASVALAGWPLHQAFMDQIDVISKSSLVTPLSYNFTALVTALTQDTFSSTDTYTSLTPHTLALVNKIALVCALVGGAVATVRASSKTLFRCVWPLLLIAVSFFSPMSWSYHFLTALAFAPVVLGGTHILPKLCLVYLFAASSIGLALVIESDDMRPQIMFAAGLSSVLALALALLLSHRATRDGTDPKIGPGG